MQKKVIVFFFFLFVLFQTITVEAQVNSTVSDSTQYKKKRKIVEDKDVVDLYYALKNKKDHPPLYQPETKAGHFHFAFVPAVGYTLQTGFAGLMSANTVLFADESNNAKASNILTSIAYTQYNQVILPLHADIWTKGNQWNIISDNRFMKYPSETFGLGAKTLDKDEDDIDFSYLRLHQSVLRNLSHDVFLGAGYFYDYFWNIHEINTQPNVVTSFEKYDNGVIHPTEIASGFNFQALYDTRKNQVNPTQGFYASINYRKNLRWLGSETHWQSTIIELKKYFTFPEHSKNVIALWNYNWFTTSTGQQKTPYLLLPSTGWDDFFNTGRGYIQGRFRGRNMSYLEAEYRFRIIRNGLLGGVVFANAEAFSKDITSLRQTIAPGYGLGLRIKLNKHSATNLCIDYGFGEAGSRGFFVNLGEVF